MEYLVPRYKRAALMLHRVPREGTKRRYLTYDFSAKGVVGRAALIRWLSHATASQLAGCCRHRRRRRRRRRCRRRSQRWVHTTMTK